MKVFLRKDIERVGLSGEIIKIGDGYARNYLLPRGLAVEITTKNEAFYQTQAKEVEDRKEVIATQTSMLAEKINSLKLTLKRKIHDDGKLYGAVNANEIVELLAKKGISVSKNQVVIDKSIKEKGSYKVRIKLSSRLNPTVTVMVVSE